MPIYPYSFQLPPLNVQDIPNDGAPGEFLGINGSGQLDWLTAGGGGSGDMLAANNLSELTNFATARTNIGLGTASTPTFANLTLTSPSLSSSAPVTISQTWGTTGTYTAFKVVATETLGAASASNLLELWSGNAATLKAYVSKVGHYVSNNLVNNDVFSNGRWLIKAQASNIGLSWSAGGSGGTTLFNGSGTASLTGSTFNVEILGFSTSPTASFSDTILLRDGAANTLALRNGAAAQTFRVYNTYTDASNYERAIFSWNSNRLEISTGQAGSGVSRKIDFGTYGATGITFFTNTQNRWGINGFDGHFIAASDNAYDIGASGANRPRTIYAGTSIFAPTIKASGTGSQSSVEITGAAGTGSIYFYPNSASVTGAITNPSDGVLRISDGAQTSFNRLQFGGTADTFPAIARDGAGIKFTGAAAGSTAWIKVPPVAVGSLPVAATAGAGARAFVNDASAPVFGTAVTGGGAVLVPVYSDGSAWNVG